MILQRPIRFWSIPRPISTVVKPRAQQPSVRSRSILHSYNPFSFSCFLFCRSCCSFFFIFLSLARSLSFFSFYYVLYLSSFAQTLQNEAHHRSEFIRSLPFARNKSPTFRKRRTALNLPLRVPRFVALFVHFQHIPDPGVCRGSCHEIEWLNRSIFFVAILWVRPMINWNERIIINVVYFWKLRSKYRFRWFVWMKISWLFCVFRGTELEELQDSYYCFQNYYHIIIIACYSHMKLFKQLRNREL